MSRRWKLRRRRLGLGSAFCSALALWPGCATTRSAIPARGECDAAMTRAKVSLPDPVPMAINSTPSIPAPAQELPIDLTTALRLAEAENPVIGEARARIGIALADLTGARVLLAPSLNAGTNYHGHTGVLQRSSGKILSVSDQSLYLGGGSQAIAAGTIAVPAVNVSAALTDALYEPLAARQRVDLTRFDASATANSVLLEVATLYQELHRAGALLAVRRRSEADAAKVTEITGGFAKAGQGREADADRARTEQQLVRASIRRAEEDVARSSAALCRRLHLDPSVRLLPAGDPLAILSLIDPESDEAGLIATAIRRRPEVSSRSAAIAVADTRLRQENARPFLPTLWLGAGGGAFGGGSNLSPPLVGNFAGRTDYDVAVYWTLENFGLGNLAIQKRRRSEVGTATAEKARTVSRVREEVASAKADALARREQIRLTVDELATSEDGFHKDEERARQARGLPIELLNNLDLLIKSREDLIDAVIGFNQAQLRLFVALGSPPPLEIPASALPPSVEVAQGSGNGTPPPEVVASDAGTQAQTTLPAGSPEDLAKAHRETMGAAAEYDRVQARLIDSLAQGKAPASRDEILAGLKALAEAHRRVVGAQTEYDRTIWSLIETPGPRPPEPVRVAVPATSDVTPR